MRGKRAKIIRHTAGMLFQNRVYMEMFPSWFTERNLYKHLKEIHKRG